MNLTRNFFTLRKKILNHLTYKDKIINLYFIKKIFTKLCLIT